MKTSTSKKALQSPKQTAKPGSATGLLQLVFITLLLGGVAPGVADPSTVLWFVTPASKFEQSLVLGNGRLGAMVFGGIEDERIILNESSLWSGSPDDNDRADAYKARPEIRRLLAEGKNVEAADLVMKNFTCKGAGSGEGNGAN